VTTTNRQQPSSGSFPATFAARAAQLDAELKRAGLRFHDMRREQQLELHLGGGERHGSGPAERVEIERLEGPIVARPVARLEGRSPIRYFLDGSQRTLPAYTFGAVPVIGAVAAAAVLERDGQGEGRVMSGMLRMRHTWLAPRRLPEVAPFLEIARRMGLDVVDPLAHIAEDAAYLDAAADYGHLVDLGQRAAHEVRTTLEIDLLRAWGEARDHAGDDGWIVVDGALHLPVPGAVGLVKSFARQYLTGEDAVCLFGLPPGQRTSAFRVADRWRFGADNYNPARTLWFLRLWDAAGRDARHSLVRIEAAPEVADPGQIDELSSWLMAERAPRAAADARWATLLYPVHYLERILKRYVDADTRGWPGARAGA
jgi:hypothetical protein